MQRTPPRVVSPARTRSNTEKMQDDEVSRTEVETSTATEEYQNHCRFIDNILKEGQKVSLPKIEQIKEKLLQWLVYQVTIENKLEFAEKENARLRKELHDKAKQTSYAQILQKSVPIMNAKTKQIEENKDNAKCVMFIKGKSGETAKQLQQKLTKAVNPAKEKIRITKLRTTTKTIILETEDDANKLMNNKQMKEKFICERQRKKKPLVIMYNVPSNLTNDDLVNAIYSQNFEDQMGKQEFQDSFVPKFKTGPREQATVHHVVEVAPELRKKIIENRRLYLHFQAIAAKDFLTIPKCLNCHDFGHIAKHCNRTEPICGHCGECTHTKNECQKRNAPAICIACTLRKKSCKAKELKDCSTYQLLMKRAISKIDYGE